MKSTAARNDIPLTIGETLVVAAARFATRDAMVFDERRATYAELLAEARTYARSLIGAGVGMGDHGEIRLKDMLKIGEENVAAVELEGFLMTHPAVRMAQVIGVADERLMEVAAAFIELEEGQALEAVDLVTFCFGQIANYKIPRNVRIVEEWPMRATKVQKFQLRQGFEPVGKFDIPAMARATA